MESENKRDKQHIIPRTYLKHWRIEEDKNFVYGIDFNNQYRKTVQVFGLNDKVFKQKRYYNDNSLQNPYIIEVVLGEDIEPFYDKIMNEINSEGNISQFIREKIIHWLYISKMRSPSMRDNTERVVGSLYKIMERYNDKNITPEKEKAIDDYAQILAKKIHLSSFVDETQVKKLLTLFIETLNAKHWRILKSNPQFEFWTNDNPGFSPNTVERFAKDVPYHHIMEMNSSSIIFFPLSPKYCLEITPFKIGTPLDTCALTMDIKFKQASLGYIEYINKGVLHTRNNLVISNNKEILEYCIIRK